MLSWIVAQSTPAVALTMLVWSYTLASMAYAVVALAHRFGHGATLRAISPVSLTPLVMIFGLFVGFLAADVWPSFERARAAVDQEAMALREAVLLADALPPEARANLRAAVRAHITYAARHGGGGKHAAHHGLRPAIQLGRCTGIADGPPGRDARLIGPIAANGMGVRMIKRELKRAYYVRLRSAVPPNELVETDKSHRRVRCVRLP